MAKSSITAAKDFFDPETILGDLCAKASIKKCSEARDVLRRYKHGSTYNDNKTAMKSNFNMGPLEETAKFLKIKTNDDKNKLRKDDLIHEIICQIQNLLPDTCQICNQRYKTGIEDAPFLACDICGQEVHKPCFMRQLGIEKGSKPNINPLNLPGVHYFCKECERNISSNFNIRFTDNRRLGEVASGPATGCPVQTDSAHTQSVAHQAEVATHCSQVASVSADCPTSQEAPGSSTVGSEVVNLDATQEVIHCSQVASGSTDCPTGSNVGSGVVTNLDATQSKPQEVIHCSQVASGSVTVTSPSKTGVTPPPLSPVLLLPPPSPPTQPQSQTNKSQETDNQQGDEPKQIKTKLCRFYASNKCKYGIKGTKCPFKHPERCAKLLKHGSKQPHGCNKGRSCPDFHPKMCQMSLSKHECFDSSCQLVHISGTKRTKPARDKEKLKKSPLTQAEPPLGSKPPTSSDSQPSSFLELARLIKEELMEAMDTKIALAISQIPPPTPPAFLPSMHQYLQHLPYQQYPPMNHLHYQQWQQAFKAATAK